MATAINLKARSESATAYPRIRPGRKLTNGTGRNPASIGQTSRVPITNSPRTNLTRPVLDCWYASRRRRRIERRELVVEVAKSKEGSQRVSRGFHRLGLIFALIAGSKLDADVQREFRLRQPWASFFVAALLVG